MQERFNKDLEEIKKSQYIMNNAINEIKNTLVATNSRITEAEDKMSEAEDRMVEINETEGKNTKCTKEHSNHPECNKDVKHICNLNLRGVERKRE